MGMLPLLLLVIAVLSVVQSLLGVGLLVFGTPTLILLGIPFDVALATLLPASIPISLFQVLHKKSSEEFRSNFNFWALPFVVIGIVFVLSTEMEFNIRLTLGAVLLVTGLIRLIPNLSSILQTIVFRSRRPFLAVIGLIHGLSNLGGGLLSLYCASIFREKEMIRAGIAYGYLLMGSIQYITLAIFRPELLSIKAIFSGATAAMIYLLIGKRVYRITAERAYQLIISILILGYGLLLLL